MPIVPEAQPHQVTPQVGPSTAINIRTNPDNFGGQIGAELRRTGDVMSRRAIEMKQENDKTAAYELDNEFSEAVRDLLHHRDDAFYRKNGRDAFEAYESTKMEMDKLKTEYTKRAANDTQRRMFEQVAGGRIESSLNAMSRHSSRERVKWLDSVDEARATEESQNAIGAWRDPAAVKIHIRTGANAIADRLERSGASAEEIQSKVEAYETQIHKQIIGAMADDNPGKARAYFEEHEDRIDADEHAVIADMLEEETLLEEVQFMSDQIWSHYSKFEDKLAAARTLEGKVREGVVKDIKVRQAEEQAIERLNEKQAYDQGEVAVRNGAKPSELPVSLRSQMDADSLTALDRLYVKIKSGDPIVTVPDLWNSFQSMAYTDPEAFLKVKLHTLQDQIEKPDLDRLYSLQRALRGSSTDRDYFTEVQDLRTQVNQLFKDTKSEEAIQMHQRVQMKATKREAELNRKLTPVEKMQLVNDTYREVVTDRGFIWDARKREFEITAEGVPDFLIDEIVVVLELEGMEASEENIQKAYRAMMGAPNGR
ncbi:MAG: hypothetical protein DBP02_02205 [gamma proteobacterium symbiont of Ctena orbiculata]|nr:MAG: hypothetical protein DBP02_02205 [gamma proteobacterium symbiont of Ctena orbiculata]